MKINIIQIMADQCIKLLVISLVVMTIQVSSHSEKGGEVLEIGGLKSYVTGPKDSNIAVILSSDVFGYEVPHLRQIADKVGAAGFYTLVPDYFHGDPYVSGRPQRTITPWLKDHPAKKGIKYAKRVVKALKRKGIKKIGAAGFCWGGKVTVDLSKSPLVQAAVLLHPTYVSLKDIKGVKVPISMLGGQNDTMAPPSLLQQFESALKAKHSHKVPSSVKIFAGAEHGWTTRYNETDAAAVKRAIRAHKDLLDWFVKYLK